MKLIITWKRHGNKSCGSIGTLWWWRLLLGCYWLLFCLFLNFGSLKDMIWWGSQDKCEELSSKAKHKTGYVLRQIRCQEPYYWALNETIKDNKRGQDKTHREVSTEGQSFEFTFVHGTTQQEAELQEVSFTFWWDSLSHFNRFGLHRLLNKNSCSWLRQRRYGNTLRVSVAQRSQPGWKNTSDGKWELWRCVDHNKNKGHYFSSPSASLMTHWWWGNFILNQTSFQFRGSVKEKIETKQMAEESRKPGHKRLKSKERNENKLKMKWDEVMMNIHI